MPVSKVPPQGPVSNVPAGSVKKKETEKAEAARRPRKTRGAGNLEYRKGRRAEREKEGNSLYLLKIYCSIVSSGQRDPLS